MKASRRLSGLIINILKLNKLEKQSIQLVLEPYDLCGQLAECALLFEDRWEEKDIEFEADLEDQAVIAADASLLELVWNNLLSNAIKFTEPGRTVTLRQTSAANSVEVTVSDTGCGMDEATLEHIFEKILPGRYLPFHRGKRSGNGAGAAHPSDHRRGYLGIQQAGGRQHIYSKNTCAGRLGTMSEIRKGGG